MGEETVGGGEVVGRVLGTQSATPLSFWVGLEPGTVVQLDEVVAARREVPGRGEVLIAGVVTNVEARHEGAAYDSDVFLIVQGVLPAAVVESAEVTVTRVEPEVYVPPLPGTVARRAGAQDRERLAPSVTSGRVALVFESAGRRYGVVRALVRSARGAVKTQEARLEELDPSVDPADGIEEMLAAPVRAVADGDGVTAAVQRITGLEYRFFTQCVVLPQGRFADFLQAEPAKRQDLLVQLLDAKTFEVVMRRANEEAKAAAIRAQAAEAQRAKLADADEAAETEAARRLEGLRALEGRVRSALDELKRTDDEIRDREAEAAEARRSLAALTALAMPGDVPTLADRLGAAREEADRLAGEANRHEEAESEARDRLAGLGDRTVLDAALRAHRDHARLAEEIAAARTEAEETRAEAADADADVAVARANLDQAEAERRRVRDAHTAAALAGRLAVGDPCPVCLRDVTDLPEHHAPAALDPADRNVQARQRDLEDARAKLRELERKLSKREEKLDGLGRQLDVQAETIRAHPDADDVRRRLEAIAAAEQEAARARKAVLAARSELAETAELRAGQRTPVFLMTTSWARHSWYLRLPTASAAPWAGIARCEAAADLPRDAVVELADHSAAIIPGVAGVGYKDPRAPQNLVPIGGLEKVLRHRLGDPGLLYRALRAATGSRSA